MTDLPRVHEPIEADRRDATQTVRALTAGRLRELLTDIDIVRLDR